MARGGGLIVGAGLTVLGLSLLRERPAPGPIPTRYITYLKYPPIAAYTIPFTVEVGLANPAASALQGDAVVEAVGPVRLLRVLGVYLPAGTQTSVTLIFNPSEMELISWPTGRYEMLARLFDKATNKFLGEMKGTSFMEIR